MTADDIRTRLDAIEAYCAAATEGPWLTAVTTVETQYGGWMPVGYAAAHVIPDRAFIAAARTDLPAVVAALRDALAEVERLTRWIEANQFRAAAFAAHADDKSAEADVNHDAWQAAESRLVDATAQIARLATQVRRVEELRAARATSRLDLLTTERDALAAEVERLRVLAVDGHIEDDDRSGYCLCGAEWICPVWIEEVSLSDRAAESGRTLGQLIDTQGQRDALAAENARLRAQVRAALATTEAGEES